MLPSSSSSFVALTHASLSAHLRKVYLYICSVRYGESAIHGKRYTSAQLKIEYHWPWPPTTEQRVLDKRLLMLQELRCHRKCATDTKLVSFLFVILCNERSNSQQQSTTTNEKNERKRRREENEKYWKNRTHNEHFKANVNAARREKKRETSAQTNK